MSALSNDGRGPATAADFREMAERLDVIADDIVILTRERDEAQTEVARLTALLAAPASTGGSRPCATWPNLPCDCRGGLGAAKSTCTRRREAEREAKRVAALSPREAAQPTPHQEH